MVSREQRQGIFAVSGPVLICLWCATLWVAGGPGPVMAGEVAPDPPAASEESAAVEPDRTGGGESSAAEQTAIATPMPDPATDADSAPAAHRAASTDAAVMAGPPAPDPAPATTGSHDWSTGVFQAGMLDGASGQFRILLWLGLSASLSWALTLFLYRRWFAPNRQARQSAPEMPAVAASAAEDTEGRSRLSSWSRLTPISRLTGRFTKRHSTRSAPVETPPVAIPTAPQPAPAALTGDSSAYSLAHAATALATAASQIATQIEQLQLLTGLSAAPSPPAPTGAGLFEPVAGGEQPLEELPPLDDELSDVEPRGLMELEGARALLETSPDTATPTTLPLTPAAGPTTPLPTAAAAAPVATPAPTPLFATASDELFPGEPDADDALTGCGLFGETDELADLEFRTEELMAEEFGWQDLPGVEEFGELGEFGEFEDLDTLANSGEPADPASTPVVGNQFGDATESDLSSHPVKLQDRPLQVAELSEMVALGLGDGELTDADGA